MRKGKDGEGGPSRVGEQLCVDEGKQAAQLAALVVIAQILPA
ncbi:hypothetical protein [Paraburkholderia mimosarum]|nr:hypothetical protein [Paraburkholderia mimosarum]